MDTKNEWGAPAPTEQLAGTAGQLVFISSAEIDRHLPCTKEIARLQSERDEAERMVASCRNVLREIRDLALIWKKSVDVEGIPIDAVLARKIDRALAGELDP